MTRLRDLIITDNTSSCRHVYRTDGLHAVTTNLERRPYNRSSVRHQRAYIIVSDEVRFYSRLFSRWPFCREFSLILLADP